MYLSHGCNDFQANPIRPVDLSHGNWERVCNGYGPPDS